MDVDAPRGLLLAFEKMKDPRMDRTKDHSLPDILRGGISSDTTMVIGITTDNLRPGLDTCVNLL